MWDRYPNMPLQDGAPEVTPILSISSCKRGRDTGLVRAWSTEETWETRRRDDLTTRTKCASCENEKTDWNKDRWRQRYHSIYMIDRCGGKRDTKFHENRAPEAIERYSASVEERATKRCLEEDQLIGLAPRKTTYAPVEVLSSRLPPHSASVK